MNLRRNIKKILVMSLQLFLIVALIGVAIGSITAGRFSLRYLFPANFLVGAFLTMSGLFLQLFPVRMKKSSLIDHTTHAEYYHTEREKKLEKAFYLIYLGIFHILITGVIQLILSVIL